MTSKHLETVAEISESELHWVRWVALAAAAVAAIALFYVWEDWHGKREWERYERQLAAQGHTLKWEAFIPAPLPDEQNIFAAPNMAAWLVGRGGNALSARLSSGREAFLEQRNTNWLLDVTFVKPETPLNPGDTDLVLEYNDKVLALGSAIPTKFPVAIIIPKLVIDQAPLSDVIRNLAVHADLQYTIDAGTGMKAAGEGPLVSGCWTELTPRSALLGVLENYGLALELDSQTHSGKVVKRAAGASTVCTTTDASRALAKLIREVSASFTNDPAQPSAYSVQSFTMFVRDTPRARPGRVFIRSEKVPEAAEVQNLFFKRVPTYFLNPEQTRATAQGTNFFHIRLSPAKYTAAADYLAWSDQLEPEFASIREALKRPFARMQGDYRDPTGIPIPNFVVIRMLVQTLAQRAQCHLLVEQPQQALEDLELIHGVCRLLDAPPGGKPMTLVAAMINVAVRGLYVGAVEEGLRLDSWREPQLAAIQDELAGVRLLPNVAEAFETERASVCHVLESATPQQVDQMLGGSASTGVWDRLRDPRYAILALSPRGWFDQNRRTVALREQNAIEAFDLSKGTILPERADALGEGNFGLHNRFSVYGFLVGMVPNSARAIQTAVRNQTLVNEALVVCALERYRLAHGRYPQTVEALRPEFLNTIPNDTFGGSPLKYRLAADGKVVLYSIGWNAKDDGGVPGTKEQNGFDAQKGDWVWPFKQRLIK